LLEHNIFLYLHFFRFFSKIEITFDFSLRYKRRPAFHVMAHDIQSRAHGALFFLLHATTRLPMCSHHAYPAGATWRNTVAAIHQHYKCKLTPLQRATTAIDRHVARHGGGHPPALLGKSHTGVALRRRTTIGEQEHDRPQSMVWHTLATVLDLIAARTRTSVGASYDGIGAVLLVEVFILHSGDAEKP
jgi:hypothetical protein